MVRIRRFNPLWVLIIAVVLLICLIGLALLGPPTGQVFSGMVRSLGSSNAPAAEQSSVSADGLVALQVTPRAPAERRVILRNASLRIVVENADESLAAISGMAEDMGGWVVNSSTNLQTTASGQPVSRGSITVRVPSERLNEALERIKSGAGTVEYENISGQDVTQQYVDLSSRLTNLEAAEVQLRGILEEAHKTEDVLSVYTELTRVRGEIESIRGQIQYFDESAAYSSINVEIIPKAIEAPIQIAGWSPGRTAERAIAALINVLQFLADAVITIALLVVPVLVILGIPAWFIRRTLRRRRQGNVTSAQP